MYMSTKEARLKFHLGNKIEITRKLYNRDGDLLFDVDYSVGCVFKVVGFSRSWSYQTKLLEVKYISGDFAAPIPRRGSVRHIFVLPEEAELFVETDNIMSEV